TNKTQL
ncbi:hypothetical protein VCHC72A2_02721B, partial [Vibrio cholerae HC-72A2]